MPKVPSKPVPIPCPACSEVPAVVRYRLKSFWVVACQSGKHELRQISGHPMGTQKDAIKAWNDEYSTAPTGAGQ